MKTRYNRIKVEEEKPKGGICDNYKPPFIEDYEIEEVKVNSVSLIVREDSTWTKKHDYYQIVEWPNGEGYDLTMQRANGEAERISLHHVDVGAFLRLLMDIGAIDDNGLLNIIE
jgi:hypothetical protein